MRDPRTIHTYVAHAVLEDPSPIRSYQSTPFPVRRSEAGRLKQPFGPLESGPHGVSEALGPVERFWNWRHHFMVTYPNAAGIIAFAKGVIVTVLIYEYA